MYRFLQGIDTNATIDVVWEPPALHFPTVSIHDYRELNKTSSHRQMLDITNPDLVGFVDVQVSQQIRIDFVPGM